jgi:hypothetical protein
VSPLATFLYVMLALGLALGLGLILCAAVILEGEAQDDVNQTRLKLVADQERKARALHYCNNYKGKS